MGVRIRYEKTDDPNVFVSTRSFDGELQAFRVRLEAGQEFSVFILNDQDVICARGEATTLSGAKIVAKKLLVSLGVAFSAESRKKKVVV